MGKCTRITTLNEISDIITNVIAPKLDITMEDITKKIKEKYTTKKEENTLE